MSELKCCPFCGGEAVLDREDIFCDNCYLSMRIDSRLSNGEAETYKEARQQAIETWNTRTPMDNIVEKLKENSFDMSLENPDCKAIWTDKAINIVKEINKEN